MRYKSKSGKTRKRVHVFPVHINNYSDINLSGPIIPKEMLQREEVDWAGFVSFKEAEDIVLFRFKDYVRSLSK